MTGRYFLDTNILVYSFDTSHPEKRDRASALISDALGGIGMISYQVVQEFLNVAQRKFSRPMTPDEARAYLDKVLLPLCRTYPDPDLYREALTLQERWRFSLYDTLIIAAARRGGCDTVFSEDLQHGQRIGDLTIIDPFR